MPYLSVDRAVNLSALRRTGHEKERNLSGLLLFSLGFVTHRVQKAFILKP